MVLLFAVFSLFAKFSGDPGLMFPTGSESAAIYSAVRDAGLYSAVTVEVDTLETNGVRRLKNELDAFAAEISDIPGVSRVEHSVSADAMEAFSHLPEVFVQLMPPDVLSEIVPEKAASSALTALVAGAPASALRSDPGGFRRPFITALQAWRTYAPFRFSAEDGFMCDGTGRYALIRVETDPAVAADSRKASRILDEISRPRSGFRMTVVSPLVRAVENESLVRGDVFRVGVVSAAALALVFLFLYRGDWRALWIPVMPFIAAAGATVVCCLLFDRVSLVVLGVGGGMAGFAVDQGIHVYTAVRGASMRDAGRLTRALLTALATSVAAFASAVVSGVPVFVQLGVFASLTLIFNFVLSRFLLPGLLGAGGCKVGMNVSLPSRNALAPIMIAALLLSVVSLSMLSGMKADFSLSSLDGTRASTRATENAFAERWKNPSAAESAVVVRDSEDSLLSALQGCGRWTPAALVPPSDVRAENLRKWRLPETAERLSRLKDALSRSCLEKGLPPEFFFPFFEAVEKGMFGSGTPERHKVLENLLSVFLRCRGRRCSALLFVPPDEVSDMLGKVADARIMSPEAVDAAAAASFIPGFRRSALLCAVLLSALVALVYRRISGFASVFLPAACAGLWGAGLASATGFKVDASACLACVLGFGLAVDYGVFALYRNDGDPGGNTARAMVLSAVTTLAGAAAMMAAEHPAVRGLGTVIFFGILFTALSALYVVPALTRWRGTHLIVISLLFSGCVCGRCGTEERFPMQPANETRIWSVTANAMWHSFPMLVAVEVNPVDGYIRAVGMTPTGMTLFESVGRNGVESKRFVSSVIPEEGAQALFENIQKDFSRIFFSADGCGPEGAGSEGVWPLWGWSVERKGMSRDGKSFRSAVYENRSGHYGFVFKEVDGDD